MEKKVYRALKAYGKLIQMDRLTGLPTGLVKDNVSTDSDYIPPHESNVTCPPYEMYWRLKENSFSCVKILAGDLEINTGQSTSVIQKIRRKLDSTVEEVIEERPNIPSDPNYINVSDRTRLECPAQTLLWREKKDTFYCVKDLSGRNTGMMSYTTLEQYIKETGRTTGVTKPNQSGDTHYVAPTLNTEVCPYTRPTSWRAKASSVYCIKEEID